MKVHKRSAILGGTLGAVAVAGALITGPVFADDTTTLPSVGSTTQGMPDGGHHDLGFGGPMLHGEGVAASTDASGTVTYITVRNQMGKVTAASDTAITVKSDDGYTKTWAISSSTVVVKDRATVKASAFAVGDVVMVSGTVDGDTVTTRFVGAGGMRGGMGGMRGGHGRGDMDGDGPMGSGGMLAPVPSASASGTSA
jgi:hypothetical protein